MPDFLDDLLDELMDPGFLDTYTNLDLYDDTINSIISLFAIPVAIFFGYALFSKKTDVTHSPAFMRAKRIVLLFVALCEIFMYSVTPDGETAFQQMGILATILSWFLIGFVLLGQVLLTQESLLWRSDKTGRYGTYEVASKGYFIYFVAVGLGLIFKSLLPYAVLFGLGVLLVQVGIDAYLTVNKGCSFWDFLLDSLWFIICWLGMMAASYVLFVVLVISFILYAILSRRRVTTACCANCRVYENGYCHYHKKEVNRSDYCDKYESR